MNDWILSLSGFVSINAMMGLLVLMQNALAWLFILSKIVGLMYILPHSESTP